MKVLLLAGGFGTRLSEETDIRPKPMVEIGGRPMLWHIMKLYSRYGYNEFVVLLGYKGYVIKEYFANYFLHQSDVTIDLATNKLSILNNSSEPWRITLLDTGVDTMTGGRVKRAQSLVAGEPFMLTYGDGVADIDIDELVRCHKGNGGAVTMTAVQPDGRFGTFDAGTDGRVASFLEKPRGDGSWINGGFFVCEPRVFDYIKQGDRSVFEREPLQTLAAEQQLYVYRHNGFWKCMDTQRDKIELNEMWTNGKRAVENLVSGTEVKSFGGIYRDKKVLVTGHTGFKGSWLTTWLLKLGERVVGVARDVPTDPAMFVELELQKRIAHHLVDIRDLDALRSVFERERPDFVFHLAAQAIVSTSYSDPVDTISTNAIGTMHVLEVLRVLHQPCHAVLVTSDKCYDNVEWIWGYRETDPLGGKDVYSGSKGAAELIIRCYVQSFMMKPDCPVKLAVGRAGNVIGGGDWAKDRIVVDCMRAWSRGESVEIRSPRATRPWQHVLEPLSGYLSLGQQLANNRDLHGETFNFGPRAEQNHSVIELLTGLGRRWGLEGEQAYRTSADVPFRESGLLKLNCDKALFHLGWQPTWNYEDTIRYVGDWYYEYYRGARHRMSELTFEQLDDYERAAKEKGRPWATG